uniref:NADH dehydrogenase subunit 2 n=1 Tax=Sternoptyx obscura TaxID=81875 RepID=UPI0028FCE310|nr:NADH dehydrogenase subunit 2 [Sternoptyx obscura]WNG77898.1 NADH dehydrogenase subunit 2 [Sternoptyx obscura]WNH23155.1 NADH dehydrogenase subunit 2 [Sternoptyx obscura]
MHPFLLAGFVSVLGLGTTLTFSSSHWFLAWMGLEMNTLAILPLMVWNHHPRGVEAATKYFLTQATAAALLLFASLTNAWLVGEWSINEMAHPIAAVVVLFALALKVGLAPLHFWLPEVLQGLPLGVGLILSTWQKFAPFVLLVQVAPLVNSHLLLGLGLVSVVTGGWGGLNQTQLRKILAYSSIAHLGWMAMIVQFMPSVAVLALLLYVVMTSTVFLAFILFGCVDLNGLADSWAKSSVLAGMLVLALLSLGGLPPLSGFMPKWLVINEMVLQGFMLSAMIAAFSALLSLYFYLRVCYVVSLTSSPKMVKAISLRFTSLSPHFFVAIMLVLGLGVLPLTPIFSCFI